MHHFVGQKHKHARQKRSLKTKAPRPNGPYVRALDKITFIAGIVGPITVFPQVYQIFTTHNAGGVSTIAWLLIFIVTLPWIFYGIAHREPAIIWSTILWEIMNALVFIGAVLYS